MKRTAFNPFKVIFYVLLVFQIIVFSAICSIAQKYLPPSDKTLLIIGQDLKSVYDYKNSEAFPEPGGVTSYLSLYDAANPNAYYPFGGLGEKLDGTVGPDIDWGAGPLNTHNASYGYPNSTLAIGLYMTEDYFPGGLTTIANGGYDTEINRLAIFLKNINKPVFLRIGYEFDGKWNTGYQNATNFKNAYKHIVDVIRPVAPNTMMVLQACTSPVDDIIEGYHENIADWYPGDNYVDYLGYSWFLNTPQQFSLTNEVLALARLHNKPVMVCESSPQGYDLKNLTYRYINTMLGGAPGTNPVSKTPDQIWTEWFQPFFKYIHDNSDVIKVVAYINANWDAQAKWASPYNEGYWGDSRVEANATIKQKWIAEVTSNSWLHGSSQLFSILEVNSSSNNPPSVSFEKPDLLTINANSNLYVKVNASDDKGVSNVKLYLNNILVRQESIAPYEWGVTQLQDPSLFGLSTGTYTLRAEAVDTDNATTSKTITVNVISSTGGGAVMNYAPANGKTLLMVGQTYTQEYQQYVTSVGKAPAGSSHYAELYTGKINQGDDGNNESFLTYINSNYPLAYAELAISIKDNPAAGGYSGPNAVWKACKDIPAGKWDTQIDAIAQSMKNRPTIKFLVRLDYEVSLNMFANKTTIEFIDILNKYTSQGINPLEKANEIPEFDLQAYKDAFNYMAQRIRVHNQVTNANFIFHPVRGINDAKQLYPGDQYVDWYGISIFNHDVCWPTWEGDNPPFNNCPTTQAFDNNIEMSLNWARDVIHKPIIIAESAAQSDVVHQSTVAHLNGYLDKVFNLIHTYDVKAFVYINSNWVSHGWSSQWGDSRVQKTDQTLQHWKDEVFTSRYIHYPSQDTDGDGTPDTNDGCPNDVAKIQPGNCGCGKTEQSCQDCAGIANGTAKTDACGVCVGGTTGKTTLDTDTDGTPDCTDIDDDNDGVADASDCDPKNASVKSAALWYADSDGDGFGDASVSKSSCTKPAGYVADKTDQCPSDANKKVPGNCGCGKTEQSCLDCAGIANGTAKTDECGVCVGGTTGKTTLDTDTDGTPDCTDTDDDNDGVADASDCDPKNASVKSAALWYADSDDDGFGDAAISKSSCTKPAGYVADKTDQCPSDVNKKIPGNCGCGKTEQSCLDCAGVPNGMAILDNCNICTGGTTGLDACVKDCNGDFGGTATMDVCGVCSGGNTGKVASTDPSVCIATLIMSSSDLGIEIYPNPFDESIFIETPQGISVQILAIDGKQIFEKELEYSQWLKLDVKPGMYVMKIIKGEKVSVKLITRQ